MENPYCSCKLTRPTAAIHVENPYCSCKLTRVPYGQAFEAPEADGTPTAEGPVAAISAGTPSPVRIETPTKGRGGCNGVTVLSPTAQGRR